MGLDVHKHETQVCIRTAAGTVHEQRIHTTRERLTVLFGPRSRARVLLDASTEGEWVAQHWEALGHEVVVGDPTYALTVREGLVRGRARSISVVRRARGRPARGGRRTWSRRTWATGYRGDDRGREREDTSGRT